MRSKQNEDIVRYVTALKNINLEIQDGQRLGIVGHNGAGKTSLLRVLSGVYPPSKGSVYTKGSINSLTDITLGMDENASGLKNIIFRLVFMGYSFEDAKKSIDEIVEFSELGDFIKLPVRTYSTGMFLRLAFAISTHFVPDILVLDEIIGAGDQAFKRKANERIQKFLQESRIVILTTHDLAAVEKYCDSAIMLEQGQIVKSGNVHDVVSYYERRASST
jgi:lipopolysaccharide transport system ATP-binding protein